LVIEMNRGAPRIEGAWFELKHPLLHFATGKIPRVGHQPRHQTESRCVCRAKFGIGAVYQVEVSSSWFRDCSPCAKVSVPNSDTDVGEQSMLLADGSPLLAAVMAALKRSAGHYRRPA
jgi:hypothetical protein